MDNLPFDPFLAFSRTLGFVTDAELNVLRSKRIAIAGVGGVGGIEMLALLRLGCEKFHIADPDYFEQQNFNRQFGALTSTLGRNKAEVLKEQGLQINPHADIKIWKEPILAVNCDDFLEGVDLFVDGVDFFVLDAKRLIFQKCHEKGIPAITAGPIGMGVAYQIFSPNGISFEEFYGFTPGEGIRSYVKFLMGISPKRFAGDYMMNLSWVNFHAKKGPSTPMACLLCAGVVGVEALKIFLERGPVYPVPYYHQFDPYKRRFVRKKMGFFAKTLAKIGRPIAEKIFLQERVPYEAHALTDPATIAEAVMDLSRWCPSRGNTQPWTLRSLSDESFSVTLERDSDILQVIDLAAQRFQHRADKTPGKGASEWVVTLTPTQEAIPEESYYLTLLDDYYGVMDKRGLTEKEQGEIVQMTKDLGGTLTWTAKPVSFVHTPILDLDHQFPIEGHSIYEYPFALLNRFLLKLFPKLKRPVFQRFGKKKGAHFFQVQVPSDLKFRLALAKRGYVFEIDHFGQGRVGRRPRKPIKSAPMRRPLTES